MERCKNVSFSKITALLLACALIFSNSLCVKECESRVSSRFKIPFEPIDTIVYTLGDTLRLSSTFDSQFITERGEEIDNSNLPASIKLDLFEIPPNSINSLGALDKFEFIETVGNLDKGSNTNNNSGGRLDLVCDDNNCEFDLGLLSIKRGYFCLVVSGGSFGLNQNDCVDNTTSLTIVDGDNNFAILEELGHDLIRLNGSLIRSSENENLYFFEVI